MEEDQPGTTLATNRQRTLKRTPRLQRQLWEGHQTWGTLTARRLWVQVPHGATCRGLFPGLSVWSLHVLPVFTRVPPIEPHNNKNMQKEQMLISPVPDQDRTGHLDLVPGRRIAGCPLLLAVPGGGRQDGLKAEETFHRLHLTACVCVCVCVVCHHSPLCVSSACRVAIKGPNVLSD